MMVWNKYTAAEVGWLERPILRMQISFRLFARMVSSLPPCLLHRLDAHLLNDLRFESALKAVPVLILVWNLLHVDATNVKPLVLAVIVLTRHHLSVASLVTDAVPSVIVRF